VERVGLVITLKTAEVLGLTILRHSFYESTKSSSPRARPTRLAPASGCRLRRVLLALVRPRTLRAAGVAGFEEWDRSHRRRYASPRLRSATHSVRM